MKKILVIGCGKESATAKEIIRHIGHDSIVFVKKADEVPISEIDNFDKIIQPTKIDTPKLIDIPFVQRAKHCRKGHERPYKFHP